MKGMREMKDMSFSWVDPKEFMSLIFFMSLMLRLFR